MFSVHFESLALLALIPVLSAVIVLLHFKGFKNVYMKLFKYSNPMVKVVSVKKRKQRRVASLALKLLIASLLVLALAKPFVLEKVVVEHESEIEVKELVDYIKPAVVVAIDVSGSMSGVIPGGVKIEVAKKVLIDFVKRLPENISVGFIAFSHQIEKSVPVTSDRERVIEAVKELKANGGTMYTYPLSSALAMLKPYRAFNATAVLIFITDGLPADRGQYEEILNKYRKLKIPIYTVYIGPGGDPGVDETKHIAEETGGKQYTAETAQDLVKIFKNISSEVQEISFKAKFKLEKEITVKRALTPLMYFTALILLVCLYATRLKISKLTF